MILNGNSYSEQLGFSFPGSKLLKKGVKGALRFAVCQGGPLTGTIVGSAAGGPVGGAAGAAAGQAAKKKCQAGGGQIVELPACGILQKLHRLFGGKPACGVPAAGGGKLAGNSYAANLGDSYASNLGAASYASQLGAATGAEEYERAVEREASPYVASREIDISGAAYESALRG